MTPGDLRARVRRCRASAQTDSLTVVLDLSELAPRVAEALEHALLMPPALDGSPMPEQAPPDFTRRCRELASDLSVRHEGDAIEFATIISAFVHECRHIHDLRSTRMGAELLLHDSQVYAGVGGLLDRLAEWQDVHSGRSVPLPLVAELSSFGGEFEDIAQAVLPSLIIRDRVWRWWNTRSEEPIVPGFSLLDLFEFVAFSTQIDWLAGVLGPEVAGIVSTAILENEDRTTKYLRPGVVLSQMGLRHGHIFEPDLQDASRLFWSALNANGIEETVNDGRGTDLHAGTWFGLFGLRLVDPTNRPQVPVGLESAWAAEDVFERHGVPGPKQRYDAAAQALERLSNSRPWSMATREPLLVAADVVPDYREMNRLILENPNYHLPQTYVDLLISGELTTVHVRTMGRDGAQGDFRTPSATPASHVGGARVASEASQQMRLLLEGIGTARPPYPAAILARMRAPRPEGLGLRFRNGLPAAKRRLGPSD